MDNMELWNKVCKTDPKYTKKVQFGRAFTAIDPMYQVRKATEVLGAAGEGWGFEAVDKTILPTDFVAMTVRVWTKSRENYIDHIGMCGLYTDNKKTKPDSDCMKKAMTDGITKGLSYFGFSADVFLGMFDDSRYIEEISKEFMAEGLLKRVDKIYQEHSNKLMSFTKDQGSEFKEWWASVKEERTELNRLDSGKAKELIKSMNVKCKEFV